MSDDSEGRAFAAIQTWLVALQEWTGCEYVERIVGGFPTEEEAEVWAERHQDLAPSVFDAMRPDEADALYGNDRSGA